MISTIENLGAAYLAFKVADLVFTYFVIRFIWRRGGLIRTRTRSIGFSFGLTRTSEAMTGESVSAMPVTRKRFVGDL